MLKALSVGCAEAGAQEGPIKPQTAGVGCDQGGQELVADAVLLLVSCYQLRVNALADFVGRYTVADG